MTGWNPPATATEHEEIRFLQGIDQFHRTTRGLDGIGYHIVPMASGRIYIVSRLDRYGAHVGGQNNHLLGLALPGDYTSALPTPPHLEAAREAVRHLYGYLGREVPTTPHLNWGGTSCPGARWQEWVPQLKEDEMGMTPEEAAKMASLEADVADLLEKHKSQKERLDDLEERANNNSGFHGKVRALAGALADGPKRGWKVTVKKD
jgi:hypothetical protein